MQSQINGFYMRYADKEGLSRAEAVKRASEFDVTEYRDRARKAVVEKDFSHGTNQWLRLFNLKMKVSRLELLKAELRLEIASLISDVNRKVFDEAREPCARRRPSTPRRPDRPGRQKMRAWVGQHTTHMGSSPRSVRSRHSVHFSATPRGRTGTSASP